MELNRLLERIKYTLIQGTTESEISGVQADSRLIGDKNLFVAVKGTASDGHAYITTAIEKGATVIVCQDTPNILEPGITYLQVADSGEALAQLASAWNGYPSEQIKLIGVTGTNGKTTIASQIGRAHV